MIGEKSLALKAKRDDLIHSHWRHAYARQIPEFMLLQERAKSLLDSLDTQFPEASSDKGQRISNISQSNSSTAIGAAPCITPQGTYWLHNRARLLLGADAIRLQGIYLTAEQESLYSSDFLFDLAGNAFNTFRCSAKLCIGTQPHNKQKRDRN